MKIDGWVISETHYVLFWIKQFSKKYVHIWRVIAINVTVIICRMFNITIYHSTTHVHICASDTSSYISEIVLFSPTADNFLIVNMFMETISISANGYTLPDTDTFNFNDCYQFSYFYVSSKIMLLTFHQSIFCTYFLNFTLN